MGDTLGWQSPAPPTGTSAWYERLAPLSTDRWWRNDAVVDQVYVSPDMRRSHLATHVIYAASAFHQLHGWPGRLHSDGRRTMLGEALVAEFRHPGRIAPLEKLLTPMDPPADA